MQNYLTKTKRGTATFAPYKPVEADEQTKGNETDERNPCTGLMGEDLEKCCYYNPKACQALGNNGKPQIYYFHLDHLGTATFLTDINGNDYSFILNLPFGETQAEQKNITNSFATTCMFIGKELDDETGLYYFGARYYDPKVSLWLSVDPLAEKYPGVSPYAYCLNNPLNIIDPDGRDIIILIFGSNDTESGADHASFAIGSNDNKLKYYSHYRKKD